MKPIQQIFPKLFSMFSGADDLLSLEPEELAGPLLLSLEGNDNIRRNSVISHNLMSLSFEHKPKMREKYPSGCDNKILFALMEAWQWLLNEGFIARRPTSLVGETSTGQVDVYFVTRRGKKNQDTRGLGGLSQGKPFTATPTSPNNRSKSVCRCSYEATMIQRFLKHSKRSKSLSAKP